MDSTPPELAPLCGEPTETSRGTKAGEALASCRGRVAVCVSLALILPGLAFSRHVHHFQRSGMVSVPLIGAVAVAAGDGLQICDPRAVNPWSGKRKFNLTGTWKERCASLPHPSKEPGTGADSSDRNWCWEYMKHNGCYASHGFSSWYEDQAKLSGLGQAPPEGILRLEGLQHPAVCEVQTFGKVWNVVDEATTSKLKSMVSVYVLSMSDERWKIISSRLQELRFPDVQRIRGVDLTLPGAVEDAVAEGLLPQKPPQLAVRHQKGTLGCAAGHLRVLKAATAKTAARAAARALRPPPLVLVLEDDVHPHEDFFGKVASILGEAPCDWEVISLKSRCPYGSCVSKHLSRVMVDGNGASCSGVNLGFFGMLYKVEALPKVRRVLAAALEQCPDVDVALASVSDQVAYYAIPAIQQPGLLHELHLGSIREAKNAG